MDEITKLAKSVLRDMNATNDNTPFGRKRRIWSTDLEKIVELSVAKRAPPLPARPPVTVGPNEKITIKPSVLEDEFVDYLYEIRQLEMDLEVFLETETIQKTPMKERAHRIFDESLDEAIPVINLNDASAMDSNRIEIHSLENAKEVPTMESVEEEAEEEVTPELHSSVEPISLELINKSRAEYEKRYSRQKVAELKKMCDTEKLPKYGRKAEIVNRLVDNKIKIEYGSPRMRQSYQNAMAAPLKTAPKSLTRSNLTGSTRSQSSIRSNLSTASKTSTTSASSVKAPANSTTSSSGSNFSRTPSFKKFASKIASPFASPRPQMFKTPSKSKLTSSSSKGVLSKTPSKADLKAKEDDRAKRIEEMKKEKEREREEKKKREAEKLAAVKKKREDELTKKREMQLKKTPAKSSKPAKKLGNLRAKIEEMQKKNNTPQKAPAHAPPPIPQPQSMPVRMESLEEDDEMVIRKEHEPTYTTPLKSMPAASSQNYEMTPQGCDKWDMNPSTKDNYNIDDLESGDETDDDEAPRKQIPIWAESKLLKVALKNQYFDYERSVTNMQDRVFFAINPDGEIKLQNIFDHIASDRARMKYRQPRRSSGQWTTMIEPTPVIDKTINFDKSVYGANGSMYF
ncbi:unnamed protein product [Oikopleura dioica]|uniref:Inner centromere protein ARK-binding domain-containing protein n=1 Tax=Oikopleura dioica TaxID=34765 RepID=E4X4R4_OIKDI|nr:unnamed protein product [Oikopleura dioica]